MAFDIEAAKADGYTDEEIQHFLNTKEIPVEQPISRGEEAMGTMQAALPQAAIYAGEGALAGAGISAIKNAFQNRAPVAQPAAPTAGPVAPNPAASPSWTAPAQQTNQASMIERGTQYAKEMQRIAAEKVIQGARAAAPMARAVAPAAIGLGAMLHSGSTGPAVPQSGPMRGMEINPNTGRPWTPEELAQLR